MNKNELLSLIGKLEVSPQDNPVAVFGAGVRGKEAVDYLLRNTLDVKAVFDNNEILNGGNILGVDIAAPFEAAYANGIRLIIIAGRYYNEISAQLDALNIDNYVSYDLFKSRFKRIPIEPGLNSAQKACIWLLNNQNKDGGIAVWSGYEHSYPEVSGYIIPTLVEYGYKSNALQIADFLSKVQNPDGTFNATASARPYLFDTAQVLRGFNSIATITDKYEEYRKKTAEALFDSLIHNGGVFPKSYEDDPEIPETIMLFALPPMLEYAIAANDLSKIKAVYDCARQYLEMPQVLSQNTLTHFLAYQIDGLIDIGFKKEVNAIIDALLKSQSVDGSIPAYKGVDWVCITGCAQIAICLYKLNNREAADKLVKWCEQNQLDTGGFWGSVGESAKYFYDREISWAVKFYLDAYKLKIQEYFNTEFYDEAPSEINDNNAEVLEIANEIVDGQSVVEIGSGKCRILKQLMKKFPDSKFSAVDISRTMLDFAPKGATTKVASMENIPFPDSSFDVVYTVEAIEHSLNIRGAVFELARICKPNGKIIIIDKQQSEWGRMETPDWESWPKRKELESILENYCDSVCSYPIRFDNYDRNDELFIKWKGIKQSVRSKLKIVLFGAGKDSDTVFHYAKRNGIDISYIVDNDISKHKTSKNGIPILPPSVLQHEPLDSTLVLLSVGSAFRDEIMSQVLEMGFQDKLNCFYWKDLLLPGKNDFKNTSGELYLSNAEGDSCELVKTTQENRIVIDKKINKLFRIIDEKNRCDFNEIFEKCKKSGIFGKYIVETSIARNTSFNIKNLMFEHRVIPIVTYACEWSPKMFIDYSLYMIEFLLALSEIGLGWSDAHAFNATFDKGKFYFFDFDAIANTITPFYQIKHFIESHINILLLMLKNQMEKAYLYLRNPGLIYTFEDVLGYLNEEEKKDYKTMYSACMDLSLRGNLKECCKVLREYIVNRKSAPVVLSGWMGYQNELYGIGENKLEDKQAAVVRMVRSVSPKSMIDLAGNMGWYSFALCKEIDYVICADLDFACIDYVYENIRKQNITNLYPVHLNLVSPITDYYKDNPIGKTGIKPWRTSSIERLSCDMVLALAVMHHLVFGQQLSFKEIIKQFSLYSKKWLIIEFIERDDSIIKDYISDKFQWYTKENFESELNNIFDILTCCHSEPTRVLYLCQKKDGCQ